jgi:heme-degrading monooxygenase HmoA
MAETAKPVLMLLALHVNNMLPMPYLFWRVRRLAQVMQRQPGTLRVHRWLSRRSLLVMSWWRDRAAAEAWLDHSEQRRMLEWAGARPKLTLWLELYELAPDGTHLRGRRMPEVAAENEESSSRQ